MKLHTAIIIATSLLHAVYCISIDVRIEEQSLDGINPFVEDDCNDRFAGCAKYDKSLCKHKQMKEMCPKYCNACRTGVVSSPSPIETTSLVTINYNTLPQSGCVDKRNFCQGKSKEYCPKSAFFRKECPKSCGTCPYHDVSTTAAPSMIVNSECDIKSVGYDGGYSCSSNSGGSSCNLHCINKEDARTDAVTHTCSYSTGIWSPPITKCSLDKLTNDVSTTAAPSMIDEDLVVQPYASGRVHFKTRCGYVGGTCKSPSRQKSQPCRGRYTNNKCNGKLEKCCISG